ncbi:MAG: hypothetical protein COY73_03535 [Candidatus Nealsonbacteria bacterium CG_4_10_14_0_8_um_filter_37_14]|uniref:General secretion pathway GspH domain-containing protein n=1 Tax=Candidatus Nealsonbacteria bacterium CG_4_10_14_0_8_um_filter_37_14 TaxID=1974684 RepID=A0A2M7R5D2_9BACT|nr:MAG: hypothetical protein COV63_00670 [Candidatus Nealsonbacteria bacterium CG11_big_fil_rev_8_21_14_0_20_37_68]PIW92235.1 MAG: hypothetical protein COZ89_01020 [Candidatus Nealsonbacteria bacterium CG_4_8_14_3_um_filter_37_23]PIY88516.1 MAG: hypothetical protein COY73_03535 [Candidatus Nealsonbacteria bacterium CG_4_10_14_0_8_um_filter_37_14]
MRGFTLAEFLIIVGIMAILVGIGFPVFKNFQPGLRLSGEVRELASDFRLAEQLAVTEQINYGIIFSTDTFPHQYQLVKYVQGQDVAEFLSKKELPEGVSFSQINFTSNQVIFNPYGAVKERGSIVLINSKNQTTTLEVGPAGFVKIIK